MLKTAYCYVPIVSLETDALSMRLYQSDELRVFEHWQNGVRSAYSSAVVYSFQTFVLPVSCNLFYLRRC